MAQKVEVIYHDEAIKELAEKWPKRAKWAMGEAVAMSGGHYRKKVRSFISSGGSGWKPLSSLYLGSSKKRGATGPQSRPLFNLAQLVRFKVVKGQSPRAQIGFFPQQQRGRAAWNKKERQRFKDFFGGTPAALAVKHEFGARYRVTSAKRRMMAAMGMPLKRSTKYVTIPARPMIAPVWRQEEQGIPAYVGGAFWRKMTSGEGPFK